MENFIDDSRLKLNSYGFLEASTPPSLDELQDYYAKRYYQNESGNYRKSYSEQELAYIQLKIEQKAHLASKLRGHNETGSFLDVGCGEGFALAYFDSIGWHVAGIDFSVGGLETMNSHMLSNVEIGDTYTVLNKYIASGKQYDLVWLSNVLEHVLDPVELLISLQKIVVSNGLLIVTVPNDGSKYQEFLLKNGNVATRFWIALPDHLSYFTYESLINTAEATGWLCRDILADFPIDLFLLHPESNYVIDRSAGSAAHKARIDFELHVGYYSHEIVNSFYSSLAQIGLGRNLTAFLKPKE